MGVGIAASDVADSPRRRSAAEKEEALISVIIPVLNELAEGNTSSYLAHLPVTMLPANFHLCRKFTIGRNNIDMSPLYVYDQETACYSFVS